MSWVPAAYSAYSTMRGGKQDAAALQAQGRVATQQALTDEETQRRQGREVLGAQAAGFAQAGGGLDQGVARQSAIAAELDALNIRYNGTVKAAGLMSMAASTRQQSGSLAGAQLLTGVSDAYTRGRMMKGGY